VVLLLVSYNELFFGHRNNLKSPLKMVTLSVENLSEASAQLSPRPARRTVPVELLCCQLRPCWRKRGCASDICI